MDGTRVYEVARGGRVWLNERAGRSASDERNVQMNANGQYARDKCR